MVHDQFNFALENYHIEKDESDYEQNVINVSDDERQLPPQD